MQFTHGVLTNVGETSEKYIVIVKQFVTRTKSMDKNIESEAKHSVNTQMLAKY